MSISPLLPISAAALGTLALPTLRQLTGGLSFAELLRVGGDDAEDAAAESAEYAASVDGQDGAAELAALPQGSAARLQGARHEAQRAAEAFRRQLADRLAEAGIDASLPMQLESDGRGGVIVSGEHPRRVAIEEIFAEHPDLARAFHELIGRFQLVQRLEQPDGSARAQPDLRQVRLLLHGEQLHARFA